MKNSSHGSNRRSFLSTLGGGAIAATAVPAIAQGLTTIRIGMVLSDAVTPVLYGTQAGLFREAGLDVQIVPGQSGAALAAAVVGGSLEAAVSSLMPLLSGYLRGVRLPIIAGSTLFVSEGPTSELCVLKTSRFNAIIDLNGAAIGSQALRSLDEVAVRGLLDKNHGNSATLKFVEIPYTLMLGALQHGRADAVSISQPNLVLALESGELRSLGATYSGIADRFLIAGYFASQAYVTQNRPVVDRLAAALHRAAQYTNTHHAETVALIADYAHMDASLVRRMTRTTNATLLDPRQIQPAIEAAVRYKYLDRSFDAKELLA